MGVYRVCKSFEVESGHMLSKHPGGCRHPHGHTRRIEIVVSSPKLNDRDMVVDFKALKLAIQDYLDLFDHAMALNSNDPLLPALQASHPDGIIVYENQDPTTEVMAEDVFFHVKGVLERGWEGVDKSGIRYRIPKGAVRLERVRVWETSSSWAEFAE